MGSSGRPRKSTTKNDILQAVAELVIERGYPRVTIDAVVSRAGTNKPAFYRRFQTLADVVPDLLSSRHGIDEDIDTGTLPGDLIEIQKRQLKLFTDPVVTRGLVGWLSEVSASPERGRPFFDNYLEPRRQFTRTILERASRRGEVEGGADPNWIADLLTGPLIMRAVLPGLPEIDNTLTAQTIEATLDALGYSGDRSAVSAYAARHSRSTERSTGSAARSAAAGSGSRRSSSASSR